jgi:hypothetical protein
VDPLAARREHVKAKSEMARPDQTRPKTTSIKKKSKGKAKKKKSSMIQRVGRPATATADI